MLNFRSAYFWPLAWRNFYASSIPPEFDHPRLTPTHTNLVILGHLVLLTRTAPGLSWKRPALSTSKRNESLHLTTSQLIIHQFSWQVMKGHESLFSIIQHCCSLLGAGPFAESTAGAATILLAHWGVETRHMHVYINKYHIYIYIIYIYVFSYIYIYSIYPPHSQ